MKRPHLANVTSWMGLVLWAGVDRLGLLVGVREAAAVRPFEDRGLDLASSSDLVDLAYLAPDRPLPDASWGREDLPDLDLACP